MKYIVLFLALLVPALAFAEPVDVNVWFGWEPVTERTDGVSASGHVSHYNLYLCDTPITVGDLEGPICDGTLRTENTGPVDNNGLIVGQIKPWQNQDGVFSIRTEAEDFDPGVEGQQWHDTDAGNNYDSHHTPYRTDPIDVDIRCYPWPVCKDNATGRLGYQLGNGSTGEWQKFTVDITEAGEYTPVVNIATEHNVTMTLDVDGKSVTFTSGSTGGWDSLKEVVGEKINLTTGAHTFKFTNTIGPMDFNWWELRGKSEVVIKDRFSDVTEPTVLYKAAVTADSESKLYSRAAAVDDKGRESALSDEVVTLIKDLIEETEPEDTLSPAPPMLRVVE